MGKKMKKIVYLVFALALTFAGLWMGSTTAQAASKPTPYQMHGKLKVSGTKLLDKKSKTVQLRGVSLHGIQHTNGSTTAFKDYANKSAFKQLRDEWGVELIRIPVYTAEGGYCQGRAQEMDKTIQNAVKYATDLGMYVIIDWHILSDGNPQIYQNQANTFFKKYAKKYKSNNHVLYEICNEPNGVDWTTVKNYAVPIIKTIRSYNKDAIVIVGTPDWSQLPTYSDSYNVAKNPIRQKDIGKSGNSLAKNVLYSIHFYSATHYDNIINNVKAAHNAGLPIFCTEFSVCDASGNGNYDLKNATKWMGVLRRYHISFVIWNLSNNNESSAMLKPNCTKLNNFKKSDLTVTAKWYIDVSKPLYDKEMKKYK